MLTQAENAPDQKKFWRYVVLGCRPCKLRKADNRRHALLYAAITDAPYFVFATAAGTVTVLTLSSA